MPRKTLVTSTLVAILFSCDAASAQAAKGISLPPVFADHMVLQRNRPVTIWGRAPSGTEIEVAFAGQRQTATATDADEWSVMLPAMPASRTGRKMLIRAIGEPTEMILLSDVVCGDVWVCAGQSNMRWRVRQSAKADEMLESAAMPDLRLIDFEGSLHTSGKAPDLAQLHSVNADNYYTTNGWHRSSRATAASFSAVAFAFGRRLTQELEVPIGVIHNAIGGAPIEAYLPSGGSEVDPAVRDVMKSWWTDPRYPAWCVERARKNLAEWIKNPEGLRPHHPFEPSFLFDAGIAPLRQFAITGIVWYQGESNAAGEPAINKAALLALIKGFRDSWNDPVLPFYFVQLPGLNRPWSLFREIQLEVAHQTPGTGMAVTIDLGHPTDIHPRRKLEVGDRLARLALAGTYERDLVPNGPLFREHQREGSRLRVRFAHAIGLQASDGLALRGFEIAGDDRKFRPAIATIDGDTVIVTALAIEEPVAVRYAFQNNPDTNLVNAELLPASPFRTDRWELSSDPPVVGTQPRPMQLLGVQHSNWTAPALQGRTHNPVTKIAITTAGSLQPLMVTACMVTIPDDIRLSDIAQVRVHYTNKNEFGSTHALGVAQPPARALVFEGKQPLQPGTNHFWVSLELTGEASFDRRVAVHCAQLLFADGSIATPEGHAMAQRIGVALRTAGQDDCHTYRIPGLATTNLGSLIAVYDCRYRGSGDLPSDIDVGMSRSIDGGGTWEPLRVIMDQGNDEKWRFDGIGDPAVLVDHTTGTIWVAATWSHGNRSWNGSGPGMAPEETGQLMLVRSDDDGDTWSKPINITTQVKNRDWRFVLQGPGKGITLPNGTLVFAAQYRSADDSSFTGKPFSTLIHSEDHGQTWTIGTGVKVDTTEAQVVQLTDGRLMLNCRDNRRGARSVYTTKDIGETWQLHSSSRSALPEPTCMASLIAMEHEQHGHLLLFSNPATRSGRRSMTLKVSRDQGVTWPARWHTLYDQGAGFGYSCLTRIDNEHIGVLYEGVRELYFLRFSIAELIGRR